MGREQMRNLEIARVGASELNEYEYQKHQGEITEQEHGGQQGTSGKRQTRAERIAEVTAAAHKKVEERRKKSGAKPKAPAKSASKRGSKGKDKSSTKSKATSTTKSASKSKKKR